MSGNLENMLTESRLSWRSHVPLRDLCHWRIGGPADYLAEPRSAEETALVRSCALASGTPYLVIGQGSNILFDDSGYRGLVIKIGKNFSACVFEGRTVRAEGGLWAPNLARACASRGLSGLEHIVGIPGSLGGLLFMNGGSLRKNIGDAVTSVHVLTPAGTIADIPAEECGFSYRRSVFQEDGSVILGAVFELQRSTPEAVRCEMLAIMEERRKKFPLNLPNCGSVFSNDADLYAAYGPPGMVIDRAGLKGLRVGDAQVSSIHANFIVNLGRASSKDVFELIREIRRQILARTGFSLRCEVRYAAPDGQCGRLDCFL